MKFMPSNRPGSKHSRSVLVGQFLVAQGVTVGQPAPLPAIGAATIKPLEFPPTDSVYRGLGSRSQVKDEQLDISGSLVGLIMTAYQMKEYAIVDEPAWTDSIARPQYYEISFARPAGSGWIMDKVPEILRALLSDRFQLKFHREMRQIPAYDLVVGESGPKFKASPAGVTFDRLPITFYSSREYNTGLSITDLTDVLARDLRHPVRDQTGVSGILNFAESVHDPPEKSVFADVQDQLGLKLVPATESMEVLVVDHAERS